MSKYLDLIHKKSQIHTLIYLEPMKKNCEFITKSEF